MSFAFENLDVYKLALEWNEEVEDLVTRHKAYVSSGFADQFSRASLSIALNIAEGNGRWHLADKRNFFWIARGSVFECVPLVELLKRKKLITSQKSKLLKEHLTAMGKMLTNLVKAHDPSSDTRARTPTPDSAKSKSKANEDGPKAATPNDSTEKRRRL